MKKSVLSIFLVSTIALIAMVFVSQLQLTKEFMNFETEVNAQTSSHVPNHILYDQLFRLAAGFRKKAEIQRLKGEKITSLHSYFKDEGQLSEEQNLILEQEAVSYMQEIEPIDNQAREIIVQIRQQFPDGHVGKGKKVPPPPPELAVLQNQRNALALSYRKKLQNLLGNEKFAVFENFVQQSFSQNFQAIGTIPQQ